ncbi:MAG: hypothetical protein ABI769_11960 [Pseudomonadota bacterium]
MQFLQFDSMPCPAPVQDKLGRLRELRAAIDGLRLEREGRDPLLAWIVAREQAETC